MKSTAIAVLLPQLPSQSCLTARLADFVSLMKPRVMSLAVFTALVGLLIAPGHLDPVLGFIAIVAIAAGSLWIMSNLNDNMMPPPELMNMHLQH